MQGNTIAKREAQLERERAFGDLRVSLAGKDIPEDVKARLLDLQDEKVALSAEAKALAEKLKASEGHVQKAKKVRTAASCFRGLALISLTAGPLPRPSSQFIREQDAMLKEAQKVRAAGAGGEFAEAQQSYETTIAELRDEVATLKVRRRLRFMNMLFPLVATLTRRRPPAQHQGARRALPARVPPRLCGVPGHGRQDAARARPRRAQGYPAQQLARAAAQKGAVPILPPPLSLSLSLAQADPRTRLLFIAVQLGGGLRRE